MEEILIKRAFLGSPTVQAVMRDVMPGDTTLVQTRCRSDVGHGMVTLHCC
jgi:hypothetical protein